MNKKIQAKQIDIQNLESSLNLDEKYANKTETQSALNAKAPIDSPSFTGEVTVPAIGTEENTKVATVGYVDDKIDEILGVENREELESTLDSIKEIQDAISSLDGDLGNIKDTTYDLLGTVNGVNGNVSISLKASDEAVEKDEIKFTGGRNTSITSDTTGNILIEDTTVYDQVPTEGSSNPVTSGGVKTAIDELGDGFLRRVNFTAIVNANNWTIDNMSGLYTQTITVEGVIEEDVPYVQPSRTGAAHLDDPVLNAWFNISRIVTIENGIVVYSNIPMLPADIPLDIICYRQRELLEVNTIPEEHIVEVLSDEIIVNDTGDTLEITDNTNSVTLI